MIKAPFGKCDICTLQDNPYVPTKFIDSQVIFLGEAPGYYEVEQQEYFVGEAGKLLEDILNGLGFKKSNFNILNACCCRPIEEGTNRNRKPSDEEIMWCNERLMYEIDQIKPSKIITLGKIPYIALGGNQKQAVGAFAGTTMDWRGYTVYMTFHPAAILHAGGSGHDRGKYIKESMIRHIKTALADQVPMNKQLPMFNIEQY